MSFFDTLLAVNLSDGGGGGGTDSYTDLKNKPQINSVTLTGNKTTADLIPLDNGLEIDTNGKLAVALGSGLDFNQDGEIETTGSYIPTSEKGVASGVATLNESGQVPATQLPSYVDDIIDGYLYEGKFYEDAQHTTEISGEDGKIYVDLETNLTYRWATSQFVEISKSLALGDTASTAYYGDKGKTAYDHSQVTTGNPHHVTAAEVNAVPTSEKAAANGVATLNGLGIIPDTQLPTYTGNKALVSDVDGKVSASSVSSTELGCLSGVTSAVQTQINDKASASDMADAQTKIRKLENSVHTHIYGVKWDWANRNDSALERTDMSRFFVEPSPAIANGTGSSPFDLIYPWCNMQDIEDIEAGSLVSIPKFWYKMTNTNGIYTLQIADAPVDGFHVSPAHMDRGDGKGERDVVYVGKYDCDSTYKSVSGATPITDITREVARANISALGNDIWQYDYLTMWTIRMLYLVEYADFNSQEKIGYGCSPNGAVVSTGYTDDMKYHTGTDAASLQTYGGTKYRGIEGLWDNVYNYVDGVYYGSASTNVIKNPSHFGESGGINIGTKIGANGNSSNYGEISQISVATAEGLAGLPFPSGKVNNSTFNIYACDYALGRSDGVILFTGGDCTKQKQNGLFNENTYEGVSGKGISVGCRLIKLP